MSAGGFDLGGDWSIQFGAYQRRSSATRWSPGSGWLCRRRDRRAGAVEDGRLFPAVQRASPSAWPRDLDFKPIGFQDAAFGRMRRGGVAVLNGGGDTMILGGHFVVQPAAMPTSCSGAMPPVAASARGRRQGGAALGAGAYAPGTHRGAAGRRLGRPAPGSHDAGAGLAALSRRGGISGGVGWLFALADPQMAAAIGAVHAEPGARWTLQALAEKSRHVALELRPEVQSDGRSLADGLPDAVADAPGR